MSKPPFRIGTVSFDYPPVYTKKEAPPGSEPEAFRDFLRNLSQTGDIDVVNAHEPLAEGRPGAGGISTPAELDAVVRYFRSRGIDALLVELRNWTRIALVVRLVTDLGLPTALVAATTGGKSGITAATATAASLAEIRRGGYVDLTERFFDTDAEELSTWLRAIAVLSRMRSSRVITFGGSYGAEMPYTRGDEVVLESRFTREILTEQEMVIVESARRMLTTNKARVNRFVDWLEENVGEIGRDNTMITPDSLALQTAFYLALRDRLTELESERLSGISVKCHFETSLTCIGCTMCLIPALLPFGVDAEGERPVVPVACEGDILGLLGLTLLHGLEPEVPPLFGDLVAYRDSHILLRNCGSSSVYWAGRSTDPKVSLPRVELLPNIHGKSGSAVHYETPGGGGPVTVARLFRSPDGFGLYYGLAEILDATPESAYPDPWPHTRLSFASDPRLIYKTTPGNHSSLTEGDFIKELEVFCRYTGITGVRCDSDEAMKQYLDRGGPTAIPPGPDRR